MSPHSYVPPLERATTQRRVRRLMLAWIAFLGTWTAVAIVEFDGAAGTPVPAPHAQATPLPPLDVAEAIAAARIEGFRAGVQAATEGACKASAALITPIAAR